MTDLAEIAKEIDEAARNHIAIAQISATKKLSVEEAYAVQSLSMQRRYGRGERRVGIKMGLTSRAKMMQVGLDEVIFGRLTDTMMVDEGEDICLSNFVHPRVEPEIAFLIKHPLSGRVSQMQAMASVEAIAPAMEIIDSRYKNFKFDIGDVIADNSSSAGFVVGNWHAPQTDISNLGLVLSIDGEARQIGSTAAILGNPVRSLVAASRMVAQHGESLNPGDIVLAGGATEAVPLAAGQSVETTFQNLGSVAFNVKS